MFPSTEDVTRAATDFVTGLAAWTCHVFDAEAGSRLLGVQQGDLDNWLETRDRSSTRLRLDADTNLTVQRMVALATFAWQGTWRSNEASLLDALTEASLIAEALRLPFADPFGEPLVPEPARDLLTKVLNAAYGRWHLVEEQDLTFDLLSALAGVSDKTLRMAANPKLPQPLPTSRGPDNRTYITAADALTWLQRRPDFQPTRFNVGTGAQPPIHSLKDLGQVCVDFRRAAGLEIRHLKERLGWSAREYLIYQNLEGGRLEADSRIFQPREMLALADLLQLPDPQAFASDAIRVVLLQQAMDELDARLQRIDKAEEAPSPTAGRKKRSMSPVADAAEPPTAHQPRSALVRRAEALLASRMDRISRGTKYIAGFRTPAGLELALERQAQEIALWSERPYPDADSCEPYAPERPRNSNLNRLNAPRLRVGNALYKLIVAEAKLGEFIDWYMGL